MDRRCIFRHYDDRHIRYDGISDSVDDKGYKGVVDMNKDKQIEEMAKDIDVICDAFGRVNFYRTAELLTAKGYRKASDVAREIFEEIENALELLQRCVEEGRKNDGIKYQQLHDGRILSIEAVEYFVDELKNKYTEGEG